MRFPANCPAFEYLGEVYEGRPWCPTKTPFGDARFGVPDGRIVLRDEFDNPVAFIGATSPGLRPLTPAAEELLQWSKGS